LKNDYKKKLGNTNLEQSIEYSETALQLATDHSNILMTAKVRTLLGKLYLEKGDKEKALESLEMAKNIASKENLKEIEANAYLSLGYYWYRLGDSIGTISNYTKSYDLFNTLKDNNGIAHSNLKLGWGYYIFGNYEDSEVSFQKALSMQNRNLIKEDTTLMVNVLLGMGSFYLNQNTKQHRTIGYFEEALELAKSQGDVFSEGRIYNALGFLYANLGQTEIAESFYLKGLDIFQKLGNKTEVNWLYTQIGEIYAANKDYDKALEQYEKALKVVEEMGVSTLSKSTIYMAIGTVHKDRGEDYKEALKYFEKSLELATTIKNNYQILNSKICIGECYLEMNDLNEAQKWCKSAYDKINDHFLLTKAACECLYKVSDRKGNHEDALFYFEKYKIHSDSLHKEELSDKINNLAAKQNYEMELAELQKEQERKAANARIKTIIWISVIGFLALLTIMSLLLSNYKKTAQKEQLQTISKVRQEMIANVSHDLRTPIMVMTGYADTLLMKQGQIKIEDQNKYLNIILDNSRRLSNLIKQLFEYSKLEADQIEPVKHSFHLGNLIEDTCTRYQIIAKNKEVNIQMKCPDEVPMVYADKTLIDRVVQNLIDNAIKFSPKNGIIEIGLKNQTDKVQVFITDKGKGISEEKKQLIFDRYKKSEESTGAGLGLTIVKKILDLHESQIKVDSKVNEGTTFAFSLPVTQ